MTPTLSRARQLLEHAAELWLSEAARLEKNMPAFQVYGPEAEQVAQQLIKEYRRKAEEATTLTLEDEFSA